MAHGASGYPFKFVPSVHNLPCARAIDPKSCMNRGKFNAQSLVRRTGWNFLVQMMSQAPAIGQCKMSNGFSRISLPRCVPLVPLEHRRACLRIHGHGGFRLQGGPADSSTRCRTESQNQCFVGGAVAVIVFGFVMIDKKRRLP